uniref:NADH dehydrogenase subunit 3 n=1 Tax=Sambus femoralis TaxID=2946729 RepID=UPI00207A7CC9|nr:NADH dehydrogenase subunit 3 [Sambus femoralis]URN73108.1 NADH dehydrogenase subunit 3 [Sambus femoralis]
MLMIFSTSMILLSISMLIMLLTTMLAKKSFSDREKNSPFECGFDPKSSARLPFSIHFFLIAVIFIIFDVEIALLIPLIFMMNLLTMTNFFIISNIFIFLLIGGILHEWKQGALSWSI